MTRDDRMNGWTLDSIEKWRSEWDKITSQLRECGRDLNISIIRREIDRDSYRSKRNS